jgi:hypothetical protein
MLKNAPMTSLQREQKTIAIMIQMFCGAHHGTDEHVLCPACEELLTYAKERLRRCPFGENKGACAKCEIHCYKPEMRKRVTEVMRYCGPRMLTKHPLLAIAHLLKAKVPRRAKAAQKKQAR